MKSLIDVCYKCKVDTKIFELQPRLHKFQSANCHAGRSPHYVRTVDRMEELRVNNLYFETTKSYKMIIMRVSHKLISLDEILILCEK